MFGYRMGPWFEEGSGLRPLHPGPGLCPQPCSARFMVGGGGLTALSLPCDGWPVVSCQQFLFPEAQQGPGGARRDRGAGPGWPYQPHPHLSLGIYLSTGTAGLQFIACQGPRAALITQRFSLLTQALPTDLRLLTSGPTCPALPFVRGWEAPRSFAVDVGVGIWLS